jgi:ligand-binding sensor domain-containing protein
MAMRRIRLFSLGGILLLWVLILSSPSYAQHRFFKNYSCAEGLISSTVYQIIDDSKGYLWCCTDNGVSRFDGMQFRNYGMQDGLTDCGAFRMFRDYRERLWFITFSGNICYYYRGRFHAFRHRDIPRSTMITWMDEAADHTLWFSTRTGELYQLDTNNNVRCIRVCNDKLVSIACAPNGAIHTATISCNYMVDTAGKVKLLLSQRLCTYTISARYFTLPDGRFLFSSEDGVHIIRGKRMERILPFNRNFLATDIRQIYQDERGDIWMCTNNGLYLFRNGVLQVQNAELVLGGEDVSFLMQDRERNYWVSTLSRGIFCLYNRDVLHYTLQNELQGNAVYKLATIPGNRLLLLQERAGVSMLCDGKVQPLFPALPIARRIVFSDVYPIDRAGRYIFNTLSRSYELTASYIRVRHTTMYLLGSTWAGNSCFMNGDSVYGCNSDGSIRFLYCLPIGGNSPSIDFCLDSNNICWIASKTGLYKYTADGKGGRFSRHPSCSLLFTDILIDKRNTVWASTLGGGIVHIQNDSISVLTTRDGLASNICSSLYCDERQNIWVTTPLGITKIIPTDAGIQQVRTYTTKDGLISNETRYISVVGSAVYVVTKEGISVLDDTAMPPPLPAPLTYIEEMRVEGQYFSPVSNHEFDESVNSISFRFIGISYRSQGAVSYRYRLLGSDTAWMYTSQNNIYYSSLTPGRYMFEVQSCNAEGLWSAESAQVHFFIRTPLWERTEVQSAGVVALGMVVGAGMWLRMRGVAKRNELRQRMIVMELQALRAQMNPHFIFNSLNSIQDFILDRQPREANYYLARFARLMRMIIEYSKRTAITIGEEVEFLTTYIQLEQLRFEERFTFSIVVDNRLPLATRIPPILLQPIVENAIKHGLTPRRGQGELSVHFSVEEKNIVCVVEDNGVGRVAAGNRRPGVEGTSVGIKNTVERIELLAALGGSASMRGGVDIVDLHNAAGEAAGTRVKILIPRLEEKISVQE